MNINKRLIFQILAFSLLFVLTIGSAIYGIVNEENFNVTYKGIQYCWEDSQSLVNKNNHHIYIDDSNFDEIKITIEGDSVTLYVLDSYTKYKISKDNVITEGNFELIDEVENQEYKDYIELLFSYFNEINGMDEFPGVLVFSFFALIPLLIGLLLLTSIFKKRSRKPSSLHYIMWSVLLIIFIANIALLFHTIKINT